MPKVQNPELYFVTPTFGRASGGLGTSAERIVTGLRQRFNLTVIVPDKGIPPQTYTEQSAVGLKTLRFGPANEEKLRLQFLSDLIAHCAAQTAPSEIFGFYAGEWSYAACLAAATLGCPCSVFCRGNDVDLDVFGDDAFRLDFLFRRSRNVFCVSNEMVGKVRAFAPGANAHCIPNGVDASEFPELPIRGGSEIPTVGIFGELKEKKGLGLLLTALPFERVTLRIVGTLRPEIQKLLQGHLALHPQHVPQIEHQPYLKSAAELIEQYSMVDIVCIPSTHEGMSNVMLEAMSCGKLVVASAVGGARDVIRDGENGYLFNPRDVADFERVIRAALGYLASGATEIQTLARQTVVKDFSWKSEQLAYFKALNVSSL